MLKELSNNLNMLMAKARISSSELARQIGIPATTIKRIRNNEQANPTIATLLPISKYFSISLNQLLGHESQLPNENSTIAKLKKIPLFSWQECSRFTLLDYEKYSRCILTERTTGARAFALKIEDNDLEFFPKDSLLIVDPDKKPVNSDYVIVANISQNITSIRKYIVEIDQLYLKPLIPGAGVIALTDEYQILGVILQYKVELKPELFSEMIKI